MRLVDYLCVKLIALPCRLSVIANFVRWPIDRVSVCACAYVPSSGYPCDQPAGQLLPYISINGGVRRRSDRRRSDELASARCEQIASLCVRASVRHIASSSHLGRVCYLRCSHGHTSQPASREILGEPLEPRCADATQQLSRSSSSSERKNRLENEANQCGGM